MAGSKLAPQFDLGNFKDGAWHQVGLTWDVETQTLRYWVDGHQAGELKQDLAQSFLGGSNFAYLGFTAATGAASNLQQLKVHAVDAIFEGDLDIHNCKFDLSNLSQKVSVVGSAAYDGASQTFVITADAVGQAGAVTFNERIDLAHDFIVSFDVYLAAKPAGGDGMAFVLHNDPRGAAALGFAGGNLGAVGLANGMAVTFDTYQNGAPFFDMPNDHSSILHTDPMIDGHHGQLGVQIGNQANLGNINNGLWHNVVITWEAETQTLKYWFDGKQANQYAGDLAHTFLGGSEYAYIGFTGATGASTNEQLVKINSVSALLEGQDHGHEPGHSPVTITDHDHNA